ncbi:interferon-induced helicase C domain-containing protein 1 [Mytilus galloprovincialis]|uniref:RNA helicase n=1 Tax=Mytilus galloprovincialis TaxID=29158 RepID=A0A8B6GIF8_MYTGA|nr:interferon-induced helicase C domain-containing protein 1 [Mytilus galloprovincialis]
MAHGLDVSHKTHYARLGHASQHLIPNILKALLAHYIPPNALLVCVNGWFKGNKSKLLKTVEWKKIHNAAKNGYDEFDTPLIYTLLRNLVPTICPTNGWDHPTNPQLRETTLGDDIERCRRYRNAILHRGNTTVKDQELDDIFNEFKSMAMRFENVLKLQPNELFFEFENLRTCCMDEDTEKMYLDRLRDIQEMETDDHESIKDLEKRSNLTEQRISKVELDMQSLTEAMQSVNSSADESLVFREPLTNKTCYEGEPISLECVVEGGKKPSKWYKGGKAVLSDKIRDESKDQTYKLSILHATREDAGVYTVKIGNKITDVRLDVIERPPFLIKLRMYQQELAKIALKGENTIICAGTNAGKTYVAFHVIESHLLTNPKAGKIVFINKTNVLLGQQYSRACDTFTTLNIQGKIKIWKAEDDDSENFEKDIGKASLIFMTPKSLSNHLIDSAAVKVSIDMFTLIIFDECHHTHDKSVYNELMSYYRIAKYSGKTHRLPQILGLTASPGTNKAKDLSSAKDHLTKVMANLDVSELSVVKRHKEELLQYTSIPEKVPITSTTRKHDPLKDIIFRAMEYVEHKLNSRIVSNFLSEILHQNRDLYEALHNPPFQRTEVRYIQWIGETKEKVEHVLHKDTQVPRLLHACLRHLELYTECLEINALLEIDQVRDVIMQGYASESFASQSANTEEEREIVSKLRDVFAEIREIGRYIEGNPDIKVVIERIENAYQQLEEESRFIIFVKTRATAIALAERLPGYLRSTYLTGSHKSVEEGGRPPDQQIDVLEKFRNGEHLCIVATSVGCEGLDVPQCNMMIRYRFSADEISSLQMRGRVRKKEGQEVIVGTTKEFETEKKNIQRQYLMTQAIDEVSKLNITRDIAIAEKLIYEKEESERRKQQMKMSKKRNGVFSVKCKYCGVLITDDNLLRHVNEKMFIVCDNTILTRIRRVPFPKKKQTEFDGCKKLDKVFGLQCQHRWGSIIIYKECEFVALSQDYIKVFDPQTDSFIDCEKWCDLPFKIQELTNDDFINYNKMPVAM